MIFDYTLPREPFIVSRVSLAVLDYVDGFSLLKGLE